MYTVIWFFGVKDFLDCIIKKNKSKLKQLAERLLEKEVIFKDDLFNILGERPFKKKNEESYLKLGKRKPSLWRVN